MKTWSRGGLESVSNCPACGSSARQGPPLTCRDHRTAFRNETWYMHRCAACKSLFLDPRPDAESLPRAYEDYYTHDKNDETPPDTRSARILWKLIHGFLNHRFGMNRQPASRWGVPVFFALPPLRLKLDYYGRHLFADRFPDRGRLLDVGCGNGTFLTRAQEMGWTVTGLEPDAKAVVVCHEQGLEVVEGDLDAAPASWVSAFDVVTMSHCIEHVEQPARDLVRLLSLLRPGGLLWMALPNPSSMAATYFLGGWRGLHAPFHLCIPSATALRAMILKAGFVDVRQVRRGVHAKMICRESALNVGSENARKSRIKSWSAPLLRPIIDLAATLSSGVAEEIVIMARRPEST